MHFYLPTMLLTAQMFPHALSLGQRGSLSMLLCSHFISKDLLPTPSSLTSYLYLFFGGTNYTSDTEELCIFISSSLLYQDGIHGNN